MSHLVKPSSYRVGKTFLWSHNLLTEVKNSEDLLFTSGVNKLISVCFKRKRLYFLKGNLVGYKNGLKYYNFLYAPKIKTLPREHRTGAFAKRCLYRPINWISQTDSAVRYLNRRKEKLVVWKKKRPKQINRWLTRRMFRGSSSFQKKRSKLSKRFKVFRIWKRQKTESGAKIYRKIKFFKKYWFINYRVWYQKWREDALKKRLFNNKTFSKKISLITRQPMKIIARNVFSYLASKKILTYKNHQTHLWHYRYRRFRFRYKNYFDIVNSLYIMSTIPGTGPTYFFSILRITLPQILKIRRFFNFINIVIKNLAQLRQRYSMFKLSIAGKLAGGTKRTKSQTIGYGVLPVQSLSYEASNNFLSYTHIYGEFGIKLLTCKHYRVAPVRISKQNDPEIRSDLKFANKLPVLKKIEGVSRLKKTAAVSTNKLDFKSPSKSILLNSKSRHSRPTKITLKGISKV